MTGYAGQRFSFDTKQALTSIANANLANEIEKSSKISSFSISSSANLSDWKDATARCVTQEQIFSLMDAFRLRDWSAEQRAEISQAYMARLTGLKQQAS